MTSTTVGTANPKSGNSGIQRPKRSGLGPLGLAVAIAAALGVSVVGAGSAQAATIQFETNTGVIQPALGSPMPSSGYQLALQKGASYASTTVSGSGRVVVGAIATLCDGPPILAVSVDGVAQDSLTITDTQNYGANMPSQRVADGNHVVKLTFNNDKYRAGVCDRNAYLSSVRMETPPATAPTQPVQPTQPVKPGVGNTGVPAGTALTARSGDITVTQDGTVLDALDVSGSIYVKANNVTIKRSIIRGGPVSKSNQALVVSWWGNTGLKVEDSTLLPAYPSLYMDALSGGNFTATRLDISKGIDSVKIIGGNATLTNSWLHGNSHFSPDPSHSDNMSHDDGVQITGGKNIVITGNNIEGAYNSAIMIGQGTVVGDVNIANNWLKDGACAINVTQNGTGGPILGMKISSNRFGAGRYGTSCPMRLPNTSPITLTGNVWDSNGTAANPVKF